MRSAGDELRLLDFTCLQISAMDTLLKPGSGHHIFRCSGPTADASGRSVFRNLTSSGQMHGAKCRVNLLCSTTKALQIKNTQVQLLLQETSKDIYFDSF